jgi:AcrR family transcriptional regulator
MGRRNDHTREELRELALRAAERLVIKHGLGGLSTRKIAASIGYTVGSLYLIFRNLDDLIAQVNERTLDELFATLKAAVSDPRLPPKTCLLALGRAYITYAITHGNRWKLIFEHRMPEGESVSDGFKDKVARMFELVQDHLRPLAGGRSQEQIELASRALWSGVHGVCILGLDQKLQATSGGRSVQEVADSLLENYLAGFTAKTASPDPEK